MLRTVLFLCGLAVAAALLAPDYLSRLSGRGETAAVAVPSQTATRREPADHGGIFRIPANRGGHFVTKIEINNRTVAAMVDTGATLVALRFEDARRLGLVFPGDTFDVGVRTANGDGRGKRVQLRSISLGPIALRDVEALVLEPGALGANLLGMSFLQRLSRFEVQRGTLVLER